MLNRLDLNCCVRNLDVLVLGFITRVTEQKELSVIIETFSILHLFYEICIPPFLCCLRPLYTPVVYARYFCWLLFRGAPSVYPLFLMASSLNICIYWASFSHSAHFLQYPPSRFVFSSSFSSLLNTGISTWRAMSRSTR